MKQIRILAAVLLMAFSLSSCESFFDVKLNDQMTLEETFSQSYTVRRFLQNIYSYIPLDEEIVGGTGYGYAGWVVPRSDEGMYSFMQWVDYLPIKTGSYSSASPTGKGANSRFFNYWPDLYVAINQCSIFLKNIDLCKDETPEKIKYMKAEVRFLRAYFYFCLFRQYGPVFLWGNQSADEKIDNTKIDRHTVDQNVDFIVGEIEAIKNDLPLNIGDVGESENTWMGRVTRGAALALKSRLLMYAASPLYNGCDLYKGKMKNIRGEFLFPQTTDENKWQKAADAAWEVIQMGKYDLCKNTSHGDDKFKNGAASYQDVFFKNWNEETIWGWWWRTSKGYEYMGGAGGQLGPALPPGLDFEYSFGGIAPSLKLVDSYPMWETGRYPVKGYEGMNDLSKPIIDQASGYVATGFTDGYKQPVDVDWASPIKAHNSCIGRDPRYYACLVPNGFWWPRESKPKKFTCWDSPECTSRWSASSNCIRVGYAWRRAYKKDLMLETGGEFYDVKYVYPAFRMAEIYLNYAEACNEKPERDEASALEYLNKVRNRSGLKNIEEAYPEIKGNKELLRWCIQKERMVEFGLEAMRHYDACRWMIAKDEYPGKNWTLHVKANTYEQSYERSSNDFAGSDNVFRDKDYLFPISATQLAEMVNMTQNYGH